jgi:hypothetical protein
MQARLASLHRHLDSPNGGSLPIHVTHTLRVRDAFGVVVLTLGTGIVSCAHESPPPPPPPEPSRDGGIDGDDAGPSSLGILDVRSCTCDSRRHLRLELKSTCPTTGGITVQVQSAGDLRITEDFPANEWRSAVTTQPLGLPRTANWAAATLYSMCSDTGERVRGAYTCLLDRKNGCL